MKIAVINGPNLNMLGYREKDVYGQASYADLLELIKNHELSKNYDISFYQSNHEGGIIDYIHQLVLEDYDALIINPGAFTHYSYAIYDALLIFKGLKIEVHLSDVLNRDDFRKILITSPACDHMISNKGVDSYIEALVYIDNNL